MFCEKKENCPHKEACTHTLTHKKVCTLFVPKINSMNSTSSFQQSTNNRNKHYTIRMIRDNKVLLILAILSIISFPQAAHWCCLVLLLVLVLVQVLVLVCDSLCYNFKYVIYIQYVELVTELRLDRNISLSFFF